ncbi:HAD-IIA family hydrolase [Nocardia sienata]|uniref:HAD-IIA family hydrolase n=1 Tax=Nocardia sienata TaxID=248552 RepID=UPI000A3EF0A7|nr:HAD hydrolase-like protein [Nocardia sienata]
MTDRLPTDTRAWILDVDGCLMRTARAGGSGGTAMPAAGEFVAALHRAGHAVIVCTNASQRPPAEYAQHLRDNGIEIADQDFVTAGSAAADYIANHHRGARVLAVGDRGLIEPLTAHGLDLADPGDRPADVVVVGAADSYTTAAINAAALAVDAGAALYTTVNLPWFHGGLGKSVAVSAAMAHAIAWAAGAEPIVLGKPSAALGETLTSRLDVDPAQISVVGDATAEIDLARSMGAHSVLVLSGATDPAALAALPDPRRPDLVATDIEDLYTRLTPIFRSTSKEPGDDLYSAREPACHRTCHPVRLLR